MVSIFGSYGTMSHSDPNGDPTVRTIYVRMDEMDDKAQRERIKQKFGSNSVSTAKYTALSFLPM